MKKRLHNTGLNDISKKSKKNHRGRALDSLDLPLEICYMIYALLVIVMSVYMLGTLRHCTAISSIQIDEQRCICVDVQRLTNVGQGFHRRAWIHSL